MASNLVSWFQKFITEKHRKVIQYISTQDRFEDMEGHGTHMAGCIAGSTLSSGKREKLGIAPNAKIAVYKIFEFKDGRSELVTNTKEMFEHYVSLGRKADAYIHNASWTSTLPKNHYTKWAAIVDSILFNNHMQLIIIAAGNHGKKIDGEQEKSLGMLGVSKNAITVGALEWGKSGYNCVAQFSSRGPTADGRIKPDIVGPGTNITSAFSQSANPELKNYLKTITSTNGDRNEWTFTGMGTSQATAILSGTAALVREYFMDGYCKLSKYGGLGSCTGQADQRNTYKPSGGKPVVVVFVSF
mmetsp:Transcript_41705/g.97628  ORF Transcript_41705/g.97628 Transcript_41705/m.97628 type:complete len:300 (+) Transcript_41705:1131-2030(+)